MNFTRLEFFNSFVSSRKQSFGTKIISYDSYSLNYIYVVVCQVITEKKQAMSSLFYIKFGDEILRNWNR